MEPSQQYTATYPAIVVNNNDPLGVGRLQLNVPMVFGPNVSPWAVPAGSYFAIPANGATVSAIFLGGDPSQPAWNGPLDLSPIVEASAPPTITYSSTQPPDPRLNDVWYELFTDSLGNTITAAAQVWTFHPLSSTFSWVVQSAFNSDNPTPGATGSAALGAGALTASVIGNLGTILNKNPFFSGASGTGWTTSGAGNTFSVVAASTLTTPPFGGYAARVVFTTAGASADKFDASADKFSVIVGNRYVSTAWVFSSNAITVNFGFEFRNSGGSPFSTLTSAFVVPSNTWTLVNTVQTAPATSVTADLTFWTSAATTLTVQAAQAFPQIQGIVDATTINAATINGAVINGGVFNGTNWIENSAGSFLYSGTPAAGNLIASIAPTSGTDGFGNAYQSGFTVYGTSGAMTQMLGTGSSTAIKMTPSGAAHVGFAPQAEAGISNAGAANEILQTIIRSGSPDGTTANSSAIVLDAPAADGSTIPSVQLFIGNGNGLAVNPTGGVLVGYPVSIATTPGGTTAEAWNTATTVNGWASTNLKYKRQANNSVRVLGVIDPAAQTNTTFFTLPTGYRPATTQDHVVGYHTATAPTQGVFIRASTSGTLAAINSATTSGVLIVDIEIPLDY